MLRALVLFASLGFPGASGINTANTALKQTKQLRSMSGDKSPQDVTFFRGHESLEASLYVVSMSCGYAEAQSNSYFPKAGVFYGQILGKCILNSIITESAVTSIAPTGYSEMQYIVTTYASDTGCTGTETPSVIIQPSSCNTAARIAGLLASNTYSNSVPSPANSVVIR